MTVPERAAASGESGLLRPRHPREAGPRFRRSGFAKVLDVLGWRGKSALWGSATLGARRLGVVLGSGPDPRDGCSRDWRAGTLGLVLRDRSFL